MDIENPIAEIELLERLSRNKRTIFVLLPSFDHRLILGADAALHCPSKKTPTEPRVDREIPPPENSLR
jgi:hypothetical protein